MTLESAVKIELTDLEKKLMQRNNNSILNGIKI